MPAYEVRRSAVIKAPPKQVFDAVVDFRTWTTWSPWLCAEPRANVQVSETPNAVGSIYSWKGELVGQGELEHQALESPKSIDQEVRFTKPFRSTSRVSFTFVPADEGTRVTWRMQGSLPWFLFWMRSQIKVFIGMDYERGLGMLREFIETGTVLSRTDVGSLEPIGPLEVIGLRASCATADVGASMAESFGHVHELFTARGLAPSDQAVSVYHRFDFMSKQCEYTCGYLLCPPSERPPAPLVSIAIPKIRALAVRHTGSYRNLGNAWSAAHQCARYKKLKLSRKVPAFEIYRNDPRQTPESELVTDVYLPLR